LLGEDADAWELLATIYSRAGKHDRALEALAKMEALAKDDEAKLYGHICRIRALLMKQDAAAANALADQVLSALKDDVDGLGMAADVLLEERSAGKELLDMADKFASRALEVAKDDETKEDVRLLKLRVLLKRKDLPAAKALGDEIFEAAKGDFIKLAPMVTPLMEGKYLSREELGMAKYLTAGANTLKKGEDWMILAFLAQIHLRQGRLDQAIELQKQAVSKCNNEETKTAAQERLDDLEAMAAEPQGSGN
jgi:tetratricopeptide (TPR) repeat protein